MSDRDQQLWVRMKLPATGGITEVPDNPGVVEDHESRGWVRDSEPRPRQIDRMPVAGSSRQRARGVADYIGRRREDHQLLLQIICTGDGRPGHGLQVVLELGRRRKADGTAETYAVGATAHADREKSFWISTLTGTKQERKCPRCPLNVQLNIATVNKMLDAMEAQYDGTPIVWRFDYRRRRLLD